MPRTDTVITPVRRKSARKEDKWSAVQQVLVPGGTGATWRPRRYDTFAKEAYLTNVIAYRCAAEIAQSVESCRWVLNKEVKGEIERVDDHPVVDLIYRPNPEYTFGELLGRHTAFSVISGNAYMERIGPATGPNSRQFGKPQRYRELWSHRPDRMTIDVNPDTGIRRQYKYTGPSGRSQEWPVDAITGMSDIWHMKLFHPLNDWYGAGPVEPTSREIDTANEAMEYNKNLLQNQGRPGMIVAFKGNIGDTEYNRLEKKLRDKYSGPRNAGKNLIIEGEGATVTSYGWSPQDLDYIEGNRELARRIALGFGVPPMLIGIPGDQTYSNYETALLAFWENTVFFYLRRISAGFSMWMFDAKERLTLAPDYDSLPALEPRRTALFKKVETADFLTVNEKRLACGYKKYEPPKEKAGNEAETAADKIYQQASQIAIGENPNEGMADDLPLDSQLDGGDFSDEELAALAANEGGTKPKKKPEEDE